MHFESQKKQLEQTMTMKREKKKESMTLRIKEKEQAMTSNLVQKQSHQMLELLAAKKEELKRDLERELEAQVFIDFSHTVKAATLIFISGRGSAIVSVKQGKSGSIYNLVKNK